MKTIDIEEMKTYFEAESGGADKLCFFDKRVAKFVGVDAAMIFNHMAFLITANEDAGRNYHDGKHWSYMTAKEIANKLEVLNERQVKYIIIQLEEAGLLESANYNKLKCDKTKWYALTDLGRKAYGRCSRRPAEEENLTDKIDNEGYENVPSTSKFVRGNGSTKDKFVRAIPNNINTTNNIKKDDEMPPLKKREIKNISQADEETPSDYEEFCQKEERNKIRDLIQGRIKTHEDFIEYFEALFWKPSKKEILNLGILECKYGYNRVADGFAAINNPYIDTIKNPIAVLDKVIKNQKRL